MDEKLLISGDSECVLGIFHLVDGRVDRAWMSPAVIDLSPIELVDRLKQVKVFVKTKATKPVGEFADKFIGEHGFLEINPSLISTVADADHNGIIIKRVEVL